MKHRLATKNDLPELKTMFDEIVSNMTKNGIDIWDEFYPYCTFANDIENNCLYVIENDSSIVAAFGLFDKFGGSDDFDWSNKHLPAMYIGRVGVNINYLNQGIGSYVLHIAETIAKDNKASHLRLLVVDYNKPAINLYLKNGYSQVPGEHIETFAEINTTLHEIGFEKKL